MRCYTLIFCLLLGRTLLAQDFSFDRTLVSKEEMDSLRKGIASPYLKAKIEASFKRQQTHRDSFIQTRIINKPIPDFDARDTSGLIHRPSMYLGRVWVVHFWHFWDNSFQYEIPSLNNLIDSLHGEGVEVLSFLSYELGESERKYLQNQPIHFPLVENAYKFGNEFFGQFFPRPFLGIIDKKGICRYFYDGNKLHLGFKYGHRNELLEENKRNQPTYDFMEKVKILLKE
ncbi:MAG: TlpA family protein disulfide reductase [Saprospiraceae bacterium]|nr:TlpA family protein disulfide reductase [Saprospiraceae bacterium]